MGCAPTNKKKNSKDEHKLSNKAVIKPSIFVIENTDTFQEIYKLGKLLGSGPLGEVRTCFLERKMEREEQ